MINFKAIELSDKQWIDKIVFAENSRSVDFGFGNMYLWDQRFCQHVAQLGNRLIVKPKYSPPPFFAFPIGTGDLAEVIEIMREYSFANGWPFRLRGVTEKHVGELESIYPGRFEFIADDDHYDYVYSAEKLATLSGKKLHGKRNHINRFTAENDWHFVPLTTALIPECNAMLENWIKDNSDKVNKSLRDEHNAIMRAFSDYEALGLEGGVLYTDGRVIAFTIGERLSSDTFDIHFEKAVSEIEGAYPMVNREFVRQIIRLHPEITYINREDDMGYPNLRQAKLSYYPEYMIVKHIALWR